jgi:hypothetical protein
MILATKENIKTALLAFGEFEVADKADKLTDEQILQIGKMAMNYIATNNLVDKTLALATVEYFEGNKRDLKRNRRDMKYYIDNPTKDEGFFGRMMKLIMKK